MEDFFVFLIETVNCDVNANYILLQELIIRFSSIIIIVLRI